MPTQAFPGFGSSVAGRVTPASFPFFTSGEDNLRLTSWNSAAGVKLKLNARTITPTGGLSPDSWDHTPNTDRTAKSSDYDLSGTTLLNLTCFASAGSPLVGQTYVTVQLIRGKGSSALVLGTILAGFVTTTVALGFPGSPIVSPFDGEPVLRQIVGTAPGVGNPILETVPTGARWELLTFFAPVSYIAGVLTNKAPALTVKDGSGNSLGVYAPAQAFAANADGSITYAEGLTPSTLPTQDIPASLSTGMRLLAGSTIGIPVTAGTFSFGAPHYSVREWIDI